MGVGNFIHPLDLCLRLNLTIVPANTFGSAVPQINFPDLFSVISPGESSECLEDRAGPMASSLPLYQGLGGFVVILDNTYHLINNPALNLGVS